MKTLAIFRHFGKEIEVFDQKKVDSLKRATATGMLVYKGERSGVPVYETSREGEDFVVTDYAEQKGIPDGIHRKRN